MATLPVDETAGTVAYGNGFLTPATTSLALPGGTLVAGHDDTYELTYSNRLVFDDTGTTFGSIAGYDDRTFGNFTTAAVPEPGSIVIAGFGLALAFWRGRRRKSA